MSSTEETHSIPLKIGLWNANSLTDTTVADVLSHCHSFSILLVTETWMLHPSTLPTTWTQFHTYGKPVRDAQHRGSQGIVALINPDCPVPVIHLSSSNPYTLSLQFGQLRLVCFYLPPSATHEQVMTALGSVSFQKDTIICGDFNARLGPLTGDMAPNGSYVTNTRGVNFRTWLEDNELTVLNSSLSYGIPTFFKGSANNDERSSIIDLYITNAPTALENSSIEVFSDYSFNSDHWLQMLSFDYTPSSTDHSPTTDLIVQPRRMWHLSKLHELESYQLYQQTFHTNAQQVLEFFKAEQQRLDDSLSVSPPDFDFMQELLCNAIFHSLDSSVGQRPQRPAHWHKYWTPVLQTMAEWRDHCYKKWRNTRDLEKIKWYHAHAEAKKRFRNDVLAAKRLSWRDYCDSLERDFNKAQSQVKFLKRKRERSSKYSHPDGPLAAATTMASHLASVYDGHTLDSPPEPIDFGLTTPVIPYESDPIHTSTLFDPGSIADCIKRLPRRKAPGVDHLRAEMLIPIAADLSQILSVFFSLCWRWCQVPSQWRLAQVFPIHKKGDPDDPGNYRPISLTSILRKLLEMVLQPQLEEFSPPIDVAQGGFRAQRSAMDQALCLHDLVHAYQTIHYRYPTVVFLDIKAAYDTVDRGVIWKALRRSGTPLPLLGFLQHLFDDVQISVLIDNQTSQPFSPSTGVLQGSVLSPMLYSIYINSLPQALRAAASPTTTRVQLPDQEEPIPINSLLFADDVAIFGSKAEVAQMLSIAATHSHTLGYRWNPSKCAVLNHPLGRGGGVNPNPLTLYNATLPQVDDFVYLGIPFVRSGISSTLLVTNRFKGTMAAMSALHKMGAHRSGFSLLLSTKLYQTFIRPKFEYGLAVTHLYKKDIAKLEQLQDRCLRLIVGGWSSSSTRALKAMTTVPDVSWRVEILQTKYLLRFDDLPEDCLLKLVSDQLGSASQIRTLLKHNDLYDSLPDDVCSWSPHQLKTYLYMTRRQRFKDIHSSTTFTFLKACRPTFGIDPVLLIPATRTERSRVLRWRFGWLAGGKPHDCVCTLDHTYRDHYNRNECPAIPPYLWDALPMAPPDVHIIDHALNLLPTNLKLGCSYWSALMTILWYIEICIRPDIPFPEDPNPGALWTNFCSAE